MTQRTKGRIGKVGTFLKETLVRPFRADKKGPGVGFVPTVTGSAPSKSVFYKKHDARTGAHRRSQLEKAQTVQKAMYSSDGRTAGLLLDALGEETNPRIAEMMLQAYQVLCIRLDGQVKLDGVKSLLEGLEKIHSNFKKHHWSESARGRLKAEVASFDNALLEAAANAFPQAGRGNRAWDNLKAVRDFGLSLEPEDPRRGVCVTLMGNVSVADRGVEVSKAESDFRQMAIIDLRGSRHEFGGAAKVAIESVIRTVGEMNGPIPVIPHGKRADKLKKTVELAVSEMLAGEKKETW